MMPEILLQLDLPPANFPFLFAAFAVTWVVFFAYAFFVSRQRQEMQREVRVLQEELDRRNAGPQDG
jgi:CcmD family protein